MGLFPKFVITKTAGQLGKGSPVRVFDTDGTEYVGFTKTDVSDLMASIDIDVVTFNATTGVSTITTVLAVPSSRNNQGPNSASWAP